MGYQLWIPDAIRDFDLPVTVEPGANTRGSINFGPRCTMCHHTGASSDITRMLRDGRPGLSGPLCNVEFRKNGHCHVIACGRANHAGSGSWRGLSGNSPFIGIEATSDGRFWTPIQRERYPILVAALNHGMGLDASWCCGHKEYAGHRGKWDPGNWDMNHMRHGAFLALERHKSGTPREEEDEMQLQSYTVTIPVSREGKEDYYPVPFPPPGRADVGRVFVTFAAVGKPGERVPASDIRVSLYTGDGRIVGIASHVSVGRGRTILPLTANLKDPILGSCSILNRGPNVVTALVEHGIK